MELCVVSSYAPKLAARGRNDSTVRSAAARRGGGAGGGGGAAGAAGAGGALNTRARCGFQSPVAF